MKGIVMQLGHYSCLGYPVRGDERNNEELIKIHPGFHLFLFHRALLKSGSINRENNEILKE
jgi:hypothetical protein